MTNRLWLLSCWAILTLAGCDSNDGDNILSIGVVLPLSGTLNNAGKAVLSGMELARDELNDSGRLGGTAIAFVTVDNKSTTDGSAAALNKLINEDRVPVIVGPVSSTSTSHVLAAADAAGVVMFSPTSSAAGLGAKSKWLFRSSLTVDRLVPTGIEVSKRNLNYRRVATIVNDGDMFSRSSNNKIVEVLDADSDITIVSSQSYSRPPGTTIGNLTNELAEIRNSSPDVIFLSGLPEDQFGILTQGHALGITNTPYISTLFAIQDVQRINAAVAGAAENAVTFQIWLSSSTAPSSKTFVSSYQARYGAVPDDWAARGYAAIEVLGAALSAVQNYQPASIQAAMAGTKGLTTIFGAFSFDENGDADYDPVVAQVKNNEFTILE